MSAAAGPAVAADFGDDAPRGRTLVDAAIRAGAAWAVTSVGADAATLRPTVRAAADAGIGLVVRLTDTKGIAGLEDALGTSLGPRDVPSLRDRLLVVVGSERAGKRLRSDARWAPSAADLGAISGGLPWLLRRAAPNYVRAMCASDDLVVPHGFFDAPRLAALAAKLRTRGARLWLSDVAPADVAALRDAPAHGLLVRSVRGGAGADGGLDTLC